jgi:hypothetical protein
MNVTFGALELAFSVVVGELRMVTVELGQEVGGRVASSGNFDIVKATSTIARFTVYL